jgi:hypothetical protein
MLADELWGTGLCIMAIFLEEGAPYFVWLLQTAALLFGREVLK